MKKKMNYLILILTIIFMVGCTNVEDTLNRIQLLILGKIKYPNYEVFAFDKVNYDIRFNAWVNFANRNSSFGQRNSTSNRYNSMFVNSAGIDNRIASSNNEHSSSKVPRQLFVRERPCFADPRFGYSGA
ncbi:hypothetical protein [Paenibacillus pabuli]|uniref:hypothetical protein n=1 Tax=Paenibacillus pabuli TaxID=1472 RepID=UPI000AA0B324|nr:hypothetical protein [Paenibacillus pabuli]MEC0128449.1 hypothetical protein [Paenibacillus pabuli]